MDEIKIVENLRKFVDAPCHPGHPEEGWDCIGMLLNFYRNCGVEMPTEFEGWNEQNYAEQWNRGEGRDVLKRFLLSLGKEIYPNFAVLGDLFIYEQKEAFAGIYLGNGHVLIAFNVGILVVPSKTLKPLLIGIKRLIE